MYKNQVLYVYVNEFESGGRFLPLILRRTLTVAAASQMLLALYFLCKENVAGFVFLFPLPLITMWVKRYLMDSYAALCDHLPYDVAIHADQLLNREEVAGHAPPAFEEFDPSLYLQPELTHAKLNPRRYRAYTFGKVSGGSHSHRESSDH